MTRYGPPSSAIARPSPGTACSSRRRAATSPGNLETRSGLKPQGLGWPTRRKEIFVPVDRQPINAALAHGNYTFSPQARVGYTLRPSIETLLHALMPHQFVVHLHPVDAVAHLVRHNCEADLQVALEDTFDWELVGYHKPGADLAQAIHAKLLEKPDLQVVLLKNHGVLLGAESLLEIERLLRILNERLKIQPRPSHDALSNVSRLSSAALSHSGYQISGDVSLHCLVTDHSLFKRLTDSWSICPDHVVFLGEVAVCIESLVNLTQELEFFKDPPPFIFVKDEGVFEHCSVTISQRAQLTFYSDVILRQVFDCLVDTLNGRQISELLNWDAEKYRQSLNSKLDS
jgi:rhamnose utilization protein RhaD (predicted bifunctional aldolase and dehydrogenase)